MKRTAGLVGIKGEGIETQSFILMRYSGYSSKIHQIHKLIFRSDRILIASNENSITVSLLGV